MKKYLNLRANIALGLIFAFLLNTIGPIPAAQAQEFRLPAPGVMVHLSPEFNPPILKGIKVHPDNPFRFDFILDQGDSSVIPAKAGIHNQEQLKQQATKLIKYFLASLTIPDKDLWVNLSPYEKDRIIPNNFGLTEMGRDLLAEDYMLKQITASLIYPEDTTGKKFWKRIYEEAEKRYGTTNIPVNTFNKVWIIPDKAVVYENPKSDTAYVVESKLKVMLEQDYLALSKNVSLRGSEAISKRTTNSGLNALGSQIIREIVIHELTKEVNENKNFANLRQVYNSLILAYWYKKKIKDSILEQVYSAKNKVAGVGYANSFPLVGRVREAGDIESIYQRYLQAFKKGVYNYIKEDQDPLTQEVVPRKYFSGGTDLGDEAMAVETFISQPPKNRDGLTKVDVNLSVAQFIRPGDRAMSVAEDILTNIGNDRKFSNVQTAFNAHEMAEFFLPLMRARADRMGLRSLVEYSLFLQQSNSSAISEKEVLSSWVRRSLFPRPGSDITNFFRDASLYENQLSNYLDSVLSEKLLGDKHVRIRHIGTAGGEEIVTGMIFVYQALRRLYDKLHLSGQITFDDWIKQWHIDVDGFDAQTENLLRIKKGVYSKANLESDLRYMGWNMGWDEPKVQDFLRQYFAAIPPTASQSSGFYRVNDEIARNFNVHPIYLNLREASHWVLLEQHQYDLTFCQNTLMYLRPESTIDLMRILKRSQNKDHLFIHEDFLIRTKDSKIDYFELPVYLKNNILREKETHAWFHEILGKDPLQVFAQGNFTIRTNLAMSAPTTINSDQEVAEDILTDIENDDRFFIRQSGMDTGKIGEFFIPLMNARAGRMGFSLADYSLFLQQSNVMAQIEKSYLSKWISMSLSPKPGSQTSFFFRGARLYEVPLSEYLDSILSEKLSGDKHVRIRHIGTAGGEEIVTGMIFVYQALRRLYDKLHLSGQITFDDWIKQWHIDIDGFDGQTENLLRIKKGIYSREDLENDLRRYFRRDWRLRKSHDFLRQYFAATHPATFQSTGFYRVKDEITRNFHVRPVYLNLQEPSQLGLLEQQHYDLTFCQNTLMYLSMDAIDNLMKALRRSQNRDHFFIHENLLIRTKDNNIVYFELPENLKSNIIKARGNYAWVAEILGKDPLQVFTEKKFTIRRNSAMSAETSNQGKGSFKKDADALRYLVEHPQSGITFEERARQMVGAGFITDPKGNKLSWRQAIGFHIGSLVLDKVLNGENKSILELRSMVPEAKGAGTNSPLWMYLLGEIRKADDLSWIDIAQIYEIAWGLPEGVSKQLFERTASALDHFFDTEEYRTKKQSLALLRELIPENLGENTQAGIWAHLLKVVHKPLKLSWSEIAQIYSVIWDLPPGIYGQNLARAGGALDRLFDTDEYKEQKQNLEVLKEFIPEVSKVTTSARLWAQLLSQVDKPKKFSWYDVANIYELLWGLPDKFSRETFLRESSALDHLFKTDEYKTKEENLTLLKAFIPEIKNPNTEIEIWNSLLDQVHKPVELKWFEVAQIYEIAWELPDKKNIRQNFLRIGSVLDHFFEKHEYSEEENSLTIIRQKIPEIKEPKTEAEIMAHLLEHAYDLKVQKGLSWHEMAQIYAVAWLPQSVKQEIMARAGSALDHLFETKQYSTKKEDMETLRELAPEINGESTERELWVNLLERVNKPDELKWSEAAQIYDIAWGLPETVNRQSFLRFSTSLDHLFAIQEFKAKGENLAVLRELIPEDGESKTVPELLAHVLLSVNKPRGLTWRDLSAIYEIAWGLPDGIKHEYLGRASSIIDQLRDEPGASKMVEYASNYVEKNEGEISRLLKINYFSHLGQSPAEPEKAVAILLKIALADNLPKSPGGPKRFNADGKRLTGLAPGSALVYMPVIAQKIIIKEVDSWNKDHGLQTNNAMLNVNNTGGIDLTPANMHLQTQNNDGTIKFHLDPTILEELRNAPGFMPVIINIQPLKSLPEFLGITH